MSETIAVHVGSDMGGSAADVGVPATAHLICRVAGHQFALPARRVRQVHRAVAVDPLPGAPDPVLGVVDVHGELLPVLGLRRLLGMTQPRVRPDDVLVHLDVRGRPLLLLVDAAESVLPIRPETVRRGEDVLPGARHLEGVAGTDGDVLAIHDLDSFLTGDELLDLGAVLSRLRADAARLHA